MYPSIADLRQAYANGINITQFLNENFPHLDRSEIIEIAYDLQSGSYTQIALEDPQRLSSYAREVYEFCLPYLLEYDVFLDCGAGELTTLSALSEYLPTNTRLLACDISLSRLKIGRRFARMMMSKSLFKNLKLFVADMVRLPLANNSVDVVFTSHALEPNHGREHELLEELIRVSRRQLLLFEPSWENATEAIRSRMDLHGYIRNLPEHIEAAGGRLVSVLSLPNSLNLLNPTYCYVVQPQKYYIPKTSDPNIYQCPRSGLCLQNQNNYWWAKEGGWAYPEIDGIPCLREKHGVLMSHE